MKKKSLLIIIPAFLYAGQALCMDQVTSYEQSNKKSCWQNTKNIASGLYDAYKYPWQIAQRAKQLSEKEFLDYLSEPENQSVELKRNITGERGVKNFFLLSLVLLGYPALDYLTKAALTNSPHSTDSSNICTSLENYSAGIIPIACMNGLAAIMCAYRAQAFERAITSIETRKKSFDAKKVSPARTQHPTEDKRPSKKKYHLPNSLRRKIKTRK